MEITPEIKEKLEALQSKYDVMGQDMLAYLDGLLYAEYVNYWDYIHLDTLMSLQQPRTPIPLVRSFEVMIDGMDKEEFLQFRMALLPASGFQSVQFRMIEFMSTDGNNLVHAEARGQYTHNSAPTNYWSELYWKRGGLEMKTGKKTLTLRRFEKKYSKTLQELATDQLNINLNRLYRPWAEDQELVKLLRRYDQLATVDWPMAHMTSAAKYLDKKPEVIEATGGTNWQKYLPPRFRRVTFFPDLWTEEELATWGKAKRGGGEGAKCPGMH